MKKEDAASGMTGLAFRTKGGGGLMFWGVNTGYWTQDQSGKLKKCQGIGPRVESMEDWQQVAEGSKEQEIFEKGEGFLVDPQWKTMVDISPYKMAVRLTRNDQYMVCLEGGTQYYQLAATNRFCKIVDKGFQSYKDWKPVTEGNILATLRFEGESVTFRDPRFPPSPIKGDAEEIKQWSETGTSPKMEEWKKNAAKEIVEHNAKVTKVTEKRQVRDAADPTIIENVGCMTTALASGMQSMVQIGQNEAAVKLATALAQLISNASWLLREDRTARTIGLHLKEGGS